MAGGPGQAGNGSTIRPNWFARHQIAAFLIFAFALSWWVWPLILFNPDSTAMVSFGPSVAAVVVSALVGGRREVVALLRAVVKWRVHWSWYLIALGGPFLIAGLVGAVAIGFGVVDTSNLGDDFGWSTWSGLPLLLLSTGLVGGPLFEELGWRGFLLPKLELEHTALWSTVVVGIVWATWHLPLLISEPSGQRPPLPFIVWILAQAVLLTWIYNGTLGSVFMVILFHAAANSANRLLLEPFLQDDGFIVAWWLMAGLYSVAAGLIIWQTRGRLGLSRPSTAAGRLNS
jgi:membrane protease YdiL (CAAX protease family)